ncbi:MAG: hypothetical protein ACJAYN_002107 [Bermanella sp.]|jgi:hypothetical protein|uniref:hypothetical protein n=1 Tax=Glaciecola sp. 33A TaxID=2057807 RepID=UPI000C3493F0|nr:hypothetical protein [Glaciecola sp. 33A]PKI02198.1 hypothetical protein CXF81_07705 [Glaciecola sp. 33A]
MNSNVDEQRRHILKSAALVSAATVLPFSSFAIGKSRPQLRILGTHVLQLLKKDIEAGMA